MRIWCYTYMEPAENWGKIAPKTVSQSFENKEKGILFLRSDVSERNGALHLIYGSYSNILYCDKLLFIFSNL